MLSRLGKLVLVVTGLLPVPAICALNNLVNGLYWHSAIYLAVAVTLGFLCFGTLGVCRRRLRVETMRTSKVKPAEREVVTFVVTYLLAFLSIPTVEFKGETYTALCVLGIIFFTVYKAESFAFNPVLAWSGYRFYEVEADGGMTYLLISKRQLNGAKNCLDVNPLSPNMFLDATPVESDDLDSNPVQVLRANPIEGATR